MPQISKGGKFVFGWSTIQNDLSVQFPEEAVREYNICSEGKVYIISGSKTTGGFSVSKKSFITSSIFKNLFNENPVLGNYETPRGELYKYKGRSFTWLDIDEQGKIQLTKNLLEDLLLKKGNRLLSIRSSNIAFTMGVKGPLIESANGYAGKIDEY